MLRVEVGARALRNEAGGEGGGGGWIQARAAEWGARASEVASSRGNIPSCELLGHMRMEEIRAYSPMRRRLGIPKYFFCGKL